MALEATEKDISIAFEKLAVTSIGGDHCKTSTTIFSHFKSKTIDMTSDWLIDLHSANFSNSL